MAIVSNLGHFFFLPCLIASSGVGSSPFLFVRVSSESLY